MFVYHKLPQPDGSIKLAYVGEFETQEDFLEKYPGTDMDELEVTDKNPHLQETDHAEENENRAGSGDLTGEHTESGQ